MAGGAGSRLVWPRPQPIDVSGVPLVGGKLWSYATGTNTPLATYSDDALTVPNTNPIIADEAGYLGDIFLLPASYKFVLLDADDAQIWTADPCGFATTVTGAIQVGTQVVWGGSSLPAGYLWCDGAAVSRTTYALLFAEISTNYGGGNGTTTFNVPDRRGRTSVGRDDMGGSPANRITVGGCGIIGTTLGATGGNQLAQQHLHGIVDPGHNHPVTDPGHDHSPRDTGGVVGVNRGLLYWDPVAGGGHFLPGVFLPTGLSANTTADNTTGLTVGDGTTSITIDNALNGASQNVQPTIIDNWIIFAGA